MSLGQDVCFVEPEARRITALKLPERSAIASPNVRQADIDILARAPAEFIDTTHFDTVRFPPPSWAAERFAEAAADGSQAYTGYRGNPRVLAEVAENLSTFLGWQVDPERNLVLTPGTQAALFSTLSARVNRGDRVAVMDPDYLFTARILGFLGAEAGYVPLRLDASGHYLPDLDRIEAEFARGARHLVFSHPNNPTGAVYPRAVLAQIASLARRYGVGVIVDELYCRLVYDGTEFAHLAAEDGMAGRTATLLGPSKTESLSGYRVGVVVGSEALIRSVENVLSITALRAPAYAQHVLMGWLKDDTDWLATRIDAFRALRESTAAAFGRLNWLRLHPQQGTAYLWIDVSALQLPDAVVASALLEKAGILVSPGLPVRPHCRRSVPHLLCARGSRLGPRLRPGGRGIAGAPRQRAGRARVNQAGTLAKQSATDRHAAGPLLQVRDLETRFFTVDGVIHALNGISYSVDRGECLAIVGESGSGKTVGVLSILRLIASPPGRITGGSVLFDGVDLLKLDNRAMRRVRGGAISVVFQDPMTSLNPVMRIGDQMTEMLKAHQKLGRAAARNRAAELLGMVGIPAPATRLSNYPHEFSGGMRQRVMIAMALACRPKLIIADEPTTALDVTIQAQIVELVKRLQSETGTAVIWISHDLGVVARLADQVAVMYAGHIVEMAPVDELYARPAHPYTLGLMHSLPRIDGGRERLTAIPGLPPDDAGRVEGLSVRPALRPCHRTVPSGQSGPGAGGRHPSRTWRGLLEPRVDVMTEAAPLLSIRDLRMHFPVRAGVMNRQVGAIKAVDGISFDIQRGETLGLVGESGCGKTTAGRAILQLYRPTGGQVTFRGADLGRQGSRRIAPDPAAHADDLPGPLCLAQSADEGGRDHRPAAAPAWHHPRSGRRGRHGRRPDAQGRAEPGVPRPLSARVLGRPAPADRYRPGAGDVAGLHRLRRADLGARRVDPGADRQPSRGSARGLGPDLSLHRP